MAYNGVYMRVLRRIAGDVRHGHAEYTDIQVRAITKQPSVDCLLARARLQYAGRLVRNRPRSLLALLHLRRRDKQLPWVQLLISDVALLRLRTGREQQLPDFCNSPSHWVQMMADETAYSKLVSDLFFVDSCCDRTSAPLHEESVARAGHQCRQCTRNFTSSRALESHQRAKHGDRLGIKNYLPSAVCPACGIDFRDRLRCIAHVSDRRRPKCREWLLENLTPITDKAVLGRLDTTDREMRRRAQRDGRSHHAASLPALRPNGRAIGRVC
jgi:hypothetical protein